MNKIVFWGDIKFDYNNFIIDKNCINIANLETSIYKNIKNVKFLEKAYINTYKFDKAITEIKKMPYNVVSLANNHILDAGSENYDLLKKVLIDNGIKIIGDKKERYKDFIINKKVIRVVGVMDKAKKYEKFIYSTNQLLQDINKLKQNIDYLIIYIHWGFESEYIKYPEPKIRYLARKIILNGADLIIGHHPHIPQYYEHINDKYIFYSIGNASYYIDEGEKYKLSKIGINIKVLVLDSEIKIDYESFFINKGFVEKKIDYMLNELSNNKFYFVKYHINASFYYINKNISSFLLRIKRYGIKHFIIFILWMFYPKTLIYWFFYIPSILYNKTKGKENGK